MRHIAEDLENKNAREKKMAETGVGEERGWKILCFWF